MTWLDRVATAYDNEPDADTQPMTVDVDPGRWVEALQTARQTLGCTFFDFLTAVDREADGFDVVVHLVAHRPGETDSLLLRTRLRAESAELACVCGVYAGAAWHERETHEMFGIAFPNHERLDPLLLPEGFEGHPLRKDFVLVSRVAKPWPGAKEPGESEGAGSPSRRRTRPPGVPDPDAWGPVAT